MGLLFSLHAAAEQHDLPETFCLKCSDGGMVCFTGMAGSARPTEAETCVRTDDYLKAELQRRAESARKRLEAERSGRDE
jgi:hypothetical protein